MAENLLSVLECLRCGRRYDLADPAPRYLCQCQGLLEVSHDLDALRRRFPDLRELFDSRARQWAASGKSGVWRYHEMVLPDLPARSIVTLGEGTTTLYPGGEVAERLGLKRLYFKHEGENPTLSFKDRGMTTGVSWGRFVGASVGICASTGDTSASMAAYTAAASGMHGVVLLPRGKITDEQLAQAMSFGARTLALDTDFDGCMRVVRKLSASKEVYLLNSMNPFRIEGQKTIGIEMIHQLGWRVPDWIVVPVGNAGNISALGKGLREARELGIIDAVPRIAGAQAARAAPFFQSYQNGFSSKATVVASPTAASAIRIGDPVSYPKAKRVIVETDGVVTQAEEKEILDAQALLGRMGIQACPNSGVALAGLQSLVTDGVIKKDDTVVVVLTAHGAKFSSTSLDYHQRRLIDDPTFANPPEPAPASAEQVALLLGLSPF